MYYRNFDNSPIHSQTKPLLSVAPQRGALPLYKCTRSYTATLQQYGSPYRIWTGVFWLKVKWTNPYSNGPYKSNFHHGQANTHCPWSFIVNQLSMNNLNTALEQQTLVPVDWIEQSSRRNQQRALPLDDTGKNDCILTELNRLLCILHLLSTTW